MNRFINESIGLLKEEESLKLTEFMSSYQLRKCEYLNLCPLNQSVLGTSQRQQTNDLMRTLSNIPTQSNKPKLQFSNTGHSERKIAKPNITPKFPQHQQRDPPKPISLHQQNAPTVRVLPAQGLSDQVVENKIKPTSSDIAEDQQPGQIDFKSYIESEQSHQIKRPPTINEEPQQEARQSSLLKALQPQQLSKIKQEQGRYSELKESERTEFLMKMENFQLQQQILIKRIMNRFNRTSNTRVNEVLNKLQGLKWQDLNLPKSQWVSKRFDYNFQVD